MKVYRVFDDEWEEIMGTVQIKQFATEQIGYFLDCNSDEEVEEEIKSTIPPHKLRIVKKFINGVKNGTITTNNCLGFFSEDDAVEILKLRTFDTEELNIY